MRGSVIGRRGASSVSPRPGSSGLPALFLEERTFRTERRYRAAPFKFSGRRLVIAAAPTLYHPTSWAVKCAVYWGGASADESAILPQCVDCSGGGSSDGYPSCCITREDRHTAVSHRVAKSLK
jgi:hypothetical protein